MKNKSTKFFYIIGVVVVLYLVSFVLLSMKEKCITLESISSGITAITTIIAAIAFWLEFSNSSDLSESSYIVKLNSLFITNKKMTKVEHCLEVYYYEQEKEHKANPALPDYFHDIKSMDHQHVINYLVYLESLAAVVKKSTLRFEAIDNLFAYRFFIAVNNKDLQESEIIPYSSFYQGLVFLSKEWTKYREARGLDIPMKENSLYLRPELEVFVNTPKKHRVKKQYK